MHFDRNQAAKQQQALDSALTSARDGGITIMGAGAFARALHKACAQIGIQVHAFVVSNPMQSQCDGLPVHPLDSVPAELLARPLWIGIFNRQAESDLTHLRKLARNRGFGTTLLPQQFFAWVQPHMGWRYWLAPLNGYESQWPLIQQARDLLADDESRDTYDALIAFRRGLSLDSTLPLCTERQYFPDSLFAHMPKGPIHYLDGGAYDGDTLREAQSTLDLAQAYVFEPDLENFRRLTAFDVDRPCPLPIVSFPLGLADAPAFLRFQSNQGEASAVDENGENQIQVAALDDLLAHVRVDFLKLDIEGSEIPALSGARRLITTFQPFLAIAGYHRWDDLWRIPLLIKGLGTDYRIALRTHANNSFESIFYAYNPSRDASLSAHFSQ